MNESNVVHIPQPEKPKAKPIRAKVSPIMPTDIVDVWRLVERSIRDGNQPYPDNTEESSEEIRSHLFAYLQGSHFAGLIARVGRRPAGVILGHLAQRPFGRPKRYFFIHCIWVDPRDRRHGVGLQLWKEYTARMKQMEIFHWEGLIHDPILEQLQKEGGIPVNRLMSVVGGRI